MKKNIKYFIKKHIPSRYLELLFNKGISITKTPKKRSVISDLFVLRIEGNWETYFECLQFNNIFNPDDKINPQEVIFCFYSKSGKYIGEQNIIISNSIKYTLKVNDIAKKFNIKKDCLFSIFHPQRQYWFNKYNSYLAERGYIGYANKNFGKIKGFVHGNLDAIARSFSNQKVYLLGNYSFFKKKYHLQYSFDSTNKYELFLVNPTSKKQTVKFILKTEDTENYTFKKIPSRGFYKHNVNSKIRGVNSHIIIESKLYLARPIVFKIMSSAFDVFHG